MVVYLWRKGKMSVVIPGDAKHRTRNLEIPGPSLSRCPGMTALVGFQRSDKATRVISLGFYPQFHAGPIGVQLQHGPKLPPL